MTSRGEGGGSPERGQVQYHILPVSGLKRRAEEELLAPKGRMWNADHRLEQSTIQCASRPCALLGRGGIYQVKSAASFF